MKKLINMALFALICAAINYTPHILSASPAYTREQILREAQDPARRGSMLLYSSPEERERIMQILADAESLPTNEQVAELMRARKSTESMMFVMAMLTDPEAWQLFKTRAAMARLAYSAGKDDATVRALIGTPMPRHAHGESVQTQIDAIRIKAIESGLVENLNDLIMLEELEDVDPENSSIKRSFRA